MSKWQLSSLLEEDLVPLIDAFPDVTTMVHYAAVWPRKFKDTVIDMDAVHTQTTADAFTIMHSVIHW